ncbi:MAG: hypothetical protein ABI867_06210 [Kofleriaceae bacterium]
MKMLGLVLLAACVDPGGDELVVRWRDSSTRCSVVELEDAVDAGALRIDFTGGDQVTLRRACDGDPVIVATREQPELVLPEGVAFAFAAHQSLAIEAGPGVEVDSIAVTITPREHATATAVVTHVALPAIAVGVNAAVVEAGTIAMVAPLDAATYVAFVGHTHRYGTGVRIAITTDAITDRIPVYLPIDFAWAAPPTQVIGPLAMPGGGRFYVQCAYYNTGTTPVTDELCGFWAYTAMPR